LTVRQKLKFILLEEKRGGRKRTALTVQIWEESRKTQVREGCEKAGSRLRWVSARNTKRGPDDRGLWAEVCR